MAENIDLGWEPIEWQPQSAITDDVRTRTRTTL